MQQGHHAPASQSAQCSRDGWEVLAGRRHVCSSLKGLPAKSGGGEEKPTAKVAFCGNIERNQLNSKNLNSEIERDVIIDANTDRKTHLEELNVSTLTNDSKNQH